MIRVLLILYFITLIVELIHILSRF